MSFATFFEIVTDVTHANPLNAYDLISCWLNYRKDFKKQKFTTGTNPDTQFLELYNTGILHEEIFKTLGKTSIGSLYRWRALLNYNSDWTALVGQYKYSTRKEYHTTLNEEQIKIFLKILLSPNSFSIGKSISLTKHILKERGYEILPKDVTFRRYAVWFRDNNYDKWILAREGQKALKDKVEPYIVRNASLLKPGQVLIADGHTLNFQVINPFTGKPCRATLLGFLDWKSGGLVGYDIMLEECTQNIASALRNAILKMDHIPEYVYQDNGRAFKSKFFNGDKKFEELGFSGVYEKLGIKPIYATPYNARAKVIERFFLDFQEGFEKLMPSYIGTSVENKPAYLKRNEKLHKQIHEQNSFTPSIEQAIKLIDKWLEFKHSQTCPNDKTKTIKEIGKITEVIGLTIESDGPKSSVGDLCYIYNELNEKPFLAEVVGFKKDKILLLRSGNPSIYSFAAEIHFHALMTKHLGQIIDNCINASTIKYQDLINFVAICKCNGVLNKKESFSLFFSNSIINIALTSDVTKIAFLASVYTLYEHAVISNAGTGTSGTALISKYLADFFHQVNFDVFIDDIFYDEDSILIQLAKENHSEESAYNY